MNRGPYSRPLDFIEAMAKNEKLFISKHGSHHTNYHLPPKVRELPEDVLELLDRYLKVAPSMVPQGKEDTQSPTLWHPDLHLDNVFVDPESQKITRIIDWQSAVVMPLFYQSCIPRMFKHPGEVADGWAVSELPENYQSLDQAEKAKIDSQRESETCHKYYESLTAKHNKRHWAALQLESIDMRTEPPRLVVGVWEDHDVFFLRRALISIVENWQELCPDSGSCPISFNAKELALHAHEEESMSGVGGILQLFRERWALPVDGMVDPAEFDQTRIALAEFREVFLDSADDETERELFAKLWPYQDAES